MNQKKRSKAQETKIAKEMNGRPTIASGALYFQKADVRTDKYLVEAKFTDAEKYMLTLATWNKIVSEALRDRMRTPMMCVQLPKECLAILRLDDFTELCKTPFVPKVLHIRELEKRVALDTSLIQGSLDSAKTILYSLLLFHDIHLVVITWDDFLLIERESEV